MGWLLIENGYQVGRYMSIEGLFLETKDEYEDAIAKSLRDRSVVNAAATSPWTMYFLSQVEEAYRRFDSRLLDAAHRRARR